MDRLVAEFRRACLADHHVAKVSMVCQHALVEWVGGVREHACGRRTAAICGERAVIAGVADVCPVGRVDRRTSQRHGHAAIPRALREPRERKERGHLGGAGFEEQEAGDEVRLAVG